MNTHVNRIHATILNSFYALPNCKREADRLLAMTEAETEKLLDKLERDMERGEVIERLVAETTVYIGIPKEEI